MNTAFLSVCPKGGSKSSLPRIVCGGLWLPGMGFKAGALVQALPEPNGISFRLCDENIKSYSALSRETDEQNGKLIQVGFSNSKNNYGDNYYKDGEPDEIA